MFGNSRALLGLVGMTGMRGVSSRCPRFASFFWTLTWDHESVSESVCSESEIRNPRLAAKPRPRTWAPARLANLGHHLDAERIPLLWCSHAHSSIWDVHPGQSLARVPGIRPGEGPYAERTDCRREGVQQASNYRRRREPGGGLPTGAVARGASGEQVLQRMRPASTRRSSASTATPCRRRSTTWCCGSPAAPTITSSTSPVTPCRR